MIGIMIASYLVVHRRRIKVEDLYPSQNPRKSIYWYSYGVNWRAGIAVRPFHLSRLYSKAEISAVDMRHYPFSARLRGKRQYKRYRAYWPHASVLYMLLDGVCDQRGNVLYLALCVSGAGGTEIC